MQMKKAVSLLLTLVLLLGVFAGITPSASAAAADATLSVDLDPANNTGEIIHGAAGFLYGVSSEDVPTTNTIVPLKSKILCTKGAVGTEHPYGDALDVAKTFLESGGQQVMMYNSNYYGVFGVTATIDQYCNDLKNYICPAVVAWKAAWKQEHGTPENTKDNFGKIDIDQAIVYIPINEGTPAGKNFYEAWEKYYKAIKEADPNATLAGPNSAGYGSQFSAGQSMAGYIQYCADNNCMPDVITWHELDTWCLSPNGLAAHMRDFMKIWANTDWTKYNAANNTTGTPEIPQICINEYAEMAYCGVPGRLVNWISRLEDEKITGCLPFWHQANNLNDLAAGANEGNGAWWLYQWYGNMSGTTQPVSSTTNYNKLYGVSTMDEAKRISTTLLGGYTGSIDVKLNNVTKTQTFQNAEYVNVTVQETAFSGFHGAANDTPVILKGVYPVAKDGSVTVTIENALFENAYNVTLTQATETDTQMAGLILKGSSGDVYEAENAALSGSAAATAASSNPSYYMSGSGNRAVSMPTGAELTYTINVPVDGKYKLEFVYGNGQGTVRNNMNQHDPVNAEQSFSLDGGEAESITMESTLFQTMTGIKTKYYDLTAGAHTITVKTLSAVGNDMLFHDFVRVSYAGVYKQDLPLLNKVYEAELADFNKLLGNADSTVRTETSIDSYSGGGYVTGLNSRSVTAGGGIRFTVVVENSGLYNLSLRYQSASAGLANIYVGNSAVILDRVNATVALGAANGWTTTTASVYLQKGINVVDIDTSVDAAIDYLRVRETGHSTNSTTIEAENAISESMQGRIQTAQSSGASGGTYVASIPGAYADPAYLEFKYNAPAAGSYQMQVFHSNEDLAGSHSYNIKATDKYAVFEVNGASDSPAFEILSGDAANSPYNHLLYFVDCGDHDPSTVSTGDSFGAYNSVTEQMYGQDPKTGYYWGLMQLNESDAVLDWNGAVTSQKSSNDKAVYTTYQRALSNDANDLLDGKDKTETFRYGHGQDRAGISPRRISYKFELEPKEYEVTVATSAAWSNASNPTVTLSADGVDKVEKRFGGSSSQVNSLIIDLSGATVNQRNRVELSVDITTTDATVAVNYLTIAEKGVYYFVDCGDHDPSTVSEGDSLGILNSVTDQHYGVDSVTGYSWGVVPLDDNDKVLTSEEGCKTTWNQNDKGVYTTYQRPLSNTVTDLNDGQGKTATFRYADAQDTSGYSPRKVQYRFELEPGQYEVTVGMSNTWGNAGNPTVTLSAGSVDNVSEQYSLSAGDNVAKTMTIDLTNAGKNENDKVELSVRATSNNDTIQMNYILIQTHTPEQNSDETAEPVTLPGGTIVSGGNELPSGIYLGELAENVPWMIDYRNLKTSTDRYFFMNTFSDDTFREKTITLDLKAGENTIRVYNDNSWNVTYGGTQWLPATTWVRNETPNFDKFVITPMALTQPITQAAQYNVSVATSQGGKAVSNMNVVEENGSYKVTIYPDAGLTGIRVLVNGVPHTPTAQDGHYMVSVSNVTSDQSVGVYFSISDENLSELLTRFKALNASDYTSNSWSAAAAAAEHAEALIDAENPAAWEITDAYQRLAAALDELVKKSKNVVYFVDCGDHDPSTVSGKADDFGRFNSVTDQIYGADSKTSYNWGVVCETEGETALGWEGGSMVTSKSDGAVYTTYQRALSNAPTDLEDGKSKTETFRYAHGQDSAGINPRYVSYQFELDPKEYDVTVCMGNTWNNAGSPKVTLTADGVDSVEQSYQIGHNTHATKTMRIDLTNAKKNTAGRVELSVKATSTDATIQMNYIVIAETAAEHQHTLNHVNRTEPTTEAEGNIEYWECTSCGKKFADADGTDEIANVTLPKLDKPSRPSNPIIPILPILSGNTEEKFPFKDVSKADWYYDSVRSAWKNNLIDGVTATEFRPDSTLTVAQAIKLAAALHQLEHLGKVTLSNGSPWYSSYVEYAVANDIIEKAYQNYTDAQMNAPVTRGEFVHIFHGAESAYAAINTVADNSIPDVKMTDKFAAEIYEFYRAGILTGSDAKGTFHSASSIKRSEVSAILVRMFDTASRQNITLK